MKPIFKIGFVFSLIIFIFSGCEEKNNDDIKIGFVAGLSGKYSALGISIRDGFLLAFDECDYMINGHAVKITEKDDKQKAQEAKKAISYFIENDFKLIVGNSTSSMTKISIEEVNKQKNSLLVSATASSDSFSRKDDNFLRIQVEQSEKRDLMKNMGA